MNAETGTEPEAPKKRGRIPQAAWPQILERYRSGVTLSAIAREFECTPSAISYIIRKAEAADAPGEDEAGAAPAEAAAEAAPAESPAPAPKASRRAAAEPKVESKAPEAKATESKAAELPAEERRPTLTVTPPAAAPAPQATEVAPAPAAPTETLRLNRPDPQPAPQPAPVAPAPVAPAAQTAASAPAPQAAAGGRAEPTPPVDAVEARLRETARGCLAAYRGWRQQPGETSIQALSDAVHELRKALARIEIDMSASRREEQAIRPIPIPAHRAARRTP
ncbi:hypothetical protein [Azospirillum soli]|uniref:hypothetical protein n=1 Tax=Azospirillum soli TaxID=1304799 RepID=UPI001AE65E7A|nr:hypothetical protein [Azospirillum soli]MBP2312285.1 transposase-like protein/outer membrane murein-binding lipoprotein Lpp [Azospirillum soli]